MMPSRKRERTTFFSPNEHTDSEAAARKELKVAQEAAANAQAIAIAIAIAAQEEVVAPTLWAIIDAVATIESSVEAVEAVEATKGNSTLARSKWSEQPNAGHKESMLDCQQLGAMILDGVEETEDAGEKKELSQYSALMTTKELEGITWGNNTDHDHNISRNFSS